MSTVGDLPNYRRHLLTVPWEQMNRLERVRYLLGARCSAPEVAAIVGLPEAEIERLREQLFPRALGYTPGGNRGFRNQPYDR